MTSVDFDIPRQTIDWATEAIEDFDTIAREFFSRVKTVEFTDNDPETGHNLFKIKLSDPIPPKLSQRCFEALSHLRNSFDQSMFAAASGIQKRPKKDIHFPWRTNPKDLEGTLKSPKSQVPSEFWNVIRQHEPYPTGEAYSGGNDQIRQLAQMANQKHTTSLRVSGYVAGGTLPSVRGNSTEFLAMPIPRWDPVNEEITLVIYSGDVEIENNYKLGFQTTFGVSGPVQNMPVKAGLELMRDKATSVLEDLEAECIKLTS